MAEGFILDKGGHYVNPTPIAWVEGQPEYSFWVGVKTGDRVQINVRAFRCEKCGFLEFYAI